MIINNSSWCKFVCGLGPLSCEEEFGAIKSVLLGDEAFNSVLEPPKRILKGLR